MNTRSGNAGNAGDTAGHENENNAATTAPATVVQAMPEATTNPRGSQTAIYLPVYDGHPESSLEVWLMQVEAILELREIRENARFKYLLTAMSQSALQWYAVKYKAARDQAMEPFEGKWSCFVHEISEAFGMTNKPFKLRKKLKELKQQENLQDFIVKFRTLSMQLPEMCEMDKIVYFMDGFKSKLKAKLTAEPPQSLEAAITKAFNLQMALEQAEEQAFQRDPVAEVDIVETPCKCNCGIQKPWQNRNRNDGRFDSKPEGKSWNSKKPWSNRKPRNRQAANLVEEDIKASNKEESCDYTAEPETLHLNMTGNEKPLLTLQARVHGRKNVSVIIDSGASANFIDETLVRSLGIPTMCSRPFKIMVANGNLVEVKYATESFCIEIQEFKDSCSCFIIEMGRPKIILGRQWLAKNNPQIDWQTDSLFFPKQSVRIEAAQGRFAALADLDTDSLALAEILTPLTHGEEEVLLVTIAPVRGGVIAKAEPAVRNILKKFQGVFTNNYPPLPPAREDTMSIDTGNSQPIYRGAYRMSPLELESLRKQLEELIKIGYVEPSSSPWASPVLFAKKKDGSLRLCVDYRGLNAVTVKNRYPLPRIDEIIDRLSKARFFSKLDLKAGYHQILLKESDRMKTAFNTRYGQYQYKVLPFGLCNAPPAFMAAMAKVFDGMVDISVLVYLDDILVFSETKDQHLEHLEEALKRLQEHEFFANEEKCEFLLEEVEFLGYLIGRGEIKPAPSKVKCIKQWTPPKNVKEVRAFIGLCSYYRKFIREFAHTAGPLYKLTCLGAHFTFGKAETQAFESLKAAITSESILRLPDFTKPFQVETDASGFATGAVLTQDFGGTQLPIAFESRRMNTAETRYPVHEQEMLAIVKACKAFRCYIEGQRFTIVTDHASLKFASTQKQLSRRMARWMELLSQFDFQIVYRKGKDNVVADALSRIPEAPRVEVMVMESNWPEDIPAYLESGSLPEDAARALEVKKNAKHFVVEDEVLYRVVQNEKRAYVPFVYRADLVWKTHNGLGHLGPQAIYENISQRY